MMLLLIADAGVQVSAGETVGELCHLLRCSQRKREIGVRMYVGAARGETSARMSCVRGWSSDSQNRPRPLGACAVTRLLNSPIDRHQPIDPGEVFSAVPVLLLAAVALIPSWLPAVARRLGGGDVEAIGYESMGVWL